jgi:hypothetical protein
MIKLRRKAVFSVRILKLLKYANAKLKMNGDKLFP